MKLEDITAEIRPRSDWEAVDLGWAMARRYFWRTLQCWAVAVVPIWLAIIVVCHQKPVWALFFIWLLKPMADRVPRYVYSRALFGEKPSAGTLLKTWPKLFFTQFFRTLFVGKFSPSRSLTAPVADLEELKGSMFSRRASVLSQQSGGTAFWMQISCVLITHAVWIGLLSVYLFFCPDRYDPNLSFHLRESLMNLGEVMTWWFGGEIMYFPTYIIWIAIGFYLLALTLIEPFYVAGGFALYLNARSHIEGWDIEIRFRQLANRLKNGGSKAAAALAAVLLLAGGGVQQLPAQDSPSDPDAAIEKVMQHPDFEVRKEQFVIREPRKKSKRERDSRWNFSGNGGRGGDGGGSSPGSGWSGSGFTGGGLGAAGSMLGWILGIGILAIALGFLVYVLVVNFLGSKKKPNVETSKPKQVMGMDVGRESLPPDVIVAARELWEEGKFQEALGLLYRAAISWLIESRHVPIEESDTEIDCMRRARRLRDDARAVNYFSQLTSLWIRAAYGRRRPDDAEMARMFDAWPFDLRPIAKS